jgi:putative transposase
MQSFERFEAGRFYHVYSHTVGGRDLFIDDENCVSFLKLYDKYISPVADTYAWVLMKNHFHVLVRVKEDVVYRYSNADRSIDAVRFEDLKWETTNLLACPAPGSVEHLKKPQPHLHFGHLLNAYARYFNKRHNFRGALFERPFERKPIDNIAYLKNVVAYIHHNPVHHGFCLHPVEYGWSSYLSCVTEKPTKLKRDEVLAWFDDIGHFERFHLNPLPQSEMEKWLGI